MCNQNSTRICFPNETARALLNYSKERFRQEQNVHLISNNKDANDLLDPQGQYPHAYVLACIMDIQVKAKNAWIIPYNLKNLIHGFDMTTLYQLSNQLSEEEKVALFDKMEKVHRFPSTMAIRFFDAVKKIHKDYNDDASRIWAGNPPSGLVVSRFLQFNGVGIKVATMATNILVRQYNIELQDKHCIDISPDTHTVRVFQRLGLISKDEHISDKKEKDHKAKIKAMYMARMINPDYPGIFDYPCWKVGQDFCKAKKQQCTNEKGTCPFFSFCPSSTEN